MINITPAIFEFRKTYFKNFFTSIALLFVLLLSNLTFGQVTLLSENFGTTTTLPTGWTSSNTTNGWNGSTASVSSTYSGFSAGANVLFAATGTNNATHTLTYSNNLSTVGYTGITVLWGARGTASFSGTIPFEWSSNGTTWNSVAYSQVAYNANWALVNSGTRIALPVGAAGVANLRFRWTGTSLNSGNFRIDDFTVQGTLAPTAPTINGNIAANEYGVHTNGSNQQTSGSTVTYMTWDDTNLYLGVSGASTSEAFVLYLDKDPQALVNGGTNANGTNVGFNYDGTSFAALQYRADLVMYVKNDYREYRTADGNNGWSTATAGFGSYAETGGNVREFSIPWSAMGGKPSAFNFFSYITSNGGFVYGQTPTENAGGNIGTSARYARYYTVSSTTAGSSTLPFSRNSYVFNSTLDIASFGAISAYDFTMNTAGKFISRTGSTSGNWVIGGSLNVGNGIIYLGSGGGSYGTTAVNGNLNISGGTFDMDQTNASVTVTGNVSLATGATLKLSSIVGGDLNIAGNWSNSGTFTPNSRLVTFNGTVAQTLTGATTFDYLRINNATGLTLQTSSPVTVNTEMNLSSGKVTLGANNFIMGSVATFINQSATSYLVTNNTGALIRNSFGNTAKPFPVGLVGSYTPLTVANTGTVNDLSLVVSSPPTNAVSDATKIVNLQWNINSSGTGSVVNATFNWNTPSNVGGTYNATGTGELGNYTTGPNYAITSIGSMAGTSKAVTGIALTSGSNRLVLGNTNAVYAVPPANDNCSSAIALTLDATAVTGNVTNATQSIPANCAGTANNDVWYSFTTTNAGDYTIKVVGSASFDAVIDVRSGACNGTNIFCADATANNGTETIVATGLTATTTYYVRVYDYGSDVPSTPTFTIAVTSPPATLSTNGATTLTFANQNVLTQSVSQTFNLSGNALTGAPGNITVSAPNTDFQVSNDDSTWGATTTIAYTSATLTATPVYVRFTPQTFGAKTGNVTFSGAGVVIPPTIALTGTGVLPAPVAKPASGVLPTQFNANWDAVTLASDGYLLDVSTSPTFGTTGSATLIEGFNAGATAPSGWTFTSIGGTYTSSGNYGASSPSLKFDGTGQQVITSSLSGEATQLSFWIKGQGTNLVSALLVEGYNGSTWVTIENKSSLPNSETTITYNASSTPVLPSNITKFRFTYSKSSGNLAFDDVAINYDTSVPDFLLGYNAKPISGQATVTSLVDGIEILSGSQYYYRLRAKSGSVISANSNTIAVKTAVTWDGSAWSNTTGPDATIDAIIEGDFNTTDDGVFTAKNLTISSGSLTVNSGTNITVVGVLNNSLAGDKVTMENNANLLQQGTVNNNTGDITVLRNSAAIKRLDYTLWSSPVTGQELYAFSPTTLPNRFYVYDPSTDKYSNSVGFNLINLQYPSPLVSPNGINGTDDNNVPFETGKSYLIRVPYDHPTTPTAFLATFTGVPNNGDVSLSVASETFNAVGNPYASTISADDFITANGITEALYFWRKTNNTDQTNNPTTSYATYTFAGGTGTGDPNTEGGSSIAPNGIIQVGQGFIVESTSTSIDFTNSMRRANNQNQFLKTTPVERNRIWLNLTTSGGAFSQMMVAYMTGATQGVDAAIDGKFFNDSPTALNSFLNNEEYVIQGRALPFDASDVVPLVFKTEGAGSYIIAIDHVDGLFEGNQDIFLRDKFTGIETNLKTGNYTFTTEAGNFTSRFEITYQTALSVNPTIFNENSIVVYKQNQDLIINSGTITMSNVKVYDIQGRLLVNQKNINATQTKITTVARNQILLVKITSAENGSVTKKVMH